MPKIIIMVNGIIIIHTIHITDKIIGKIKIKTMIRKALLVMVIQGRLLIIITLTIVVNTYQKFIILLIPVFMV
jgi:hypothetical protein